MSIIKTKKRRAISPVLSVLLMIVVAVAGALVTYAWSMGYLDLTTARAGRAIQIQSVALNEDRDQLYIYVQNVGQGSVNFDPDGLDIVYLNGALVPTSGQHAALAEGDTMTLVVDILDPPHPINEDIKIKIAAERGTAIQATVYPDSTAGATGGGVITPPPEVTRVSSTNTGFSGVQAGDLLVVIANHRTGTFVTDGETATAAGYETVEVASFMTSTGDRRAVALLIKTATGSESGTVTVTWGGGASTYTTIYQIYRGATTWTSGASDVDHGVGSSDSSSVSISGLPTSTSANVLTIGALVTRDNPGTVGMTNLGSQDTSDSGGAYLITEHSYGDAVTETAMSLSTAQQASGLLAQIACTD
jgi:archaellum component FlaF (FlaF/FlaG flagellin family)